MFSKLQYISQGNSAQEQILSIQKGLDAGCDWIQLRFKPVRPVGGNENEIDSLAEQVKKICDEYKSILIVNDFIDVAKKIDADGVHLGLNDDSVSLAREILGTNKIIGGTANSLEDVLKRIDEKCDYLGLGPFRFTETKTNLSPILSFEKYISIQKELENKKLTIPIYAIGGILLADIESILESGIYGIALSGLIHSSENPREIVEQIKKITYVNA